MVNFQCPEKCMPKPNGTSFGLLGSACLPKVVLEVFKFLCKTRAFTALIDETFNLTHYLANTHDSAHLHGRKQYFPKLLLAVVHKGNPDFIQFSQLLHLNAIDVECIV